MQNIPLEMDLLVVGNEPAGLWLLREYARLHPKEAALKKLNIPEPKLGWLRIEEPTVPLPLPQGTARYFQIETSSSYSAEIVSPSNLFRWSPEKVFSHFKGLPRTLEKRFSETLQPPNTKERQLIKEAIARQPELLTLSQAVWKRIGRCRKMTPESTVWAALQALEISDWSPETLITHLPQLKTISWGEKHQWTALEEIKNPNPQIKGKLFKITLSSGTVVLTKTLVLNLNVRQLKQYILDVNLKEWAPIPDPILSRFSQYPITLKFENYRLPQNVQPLTILLDQEILPEPDLEMWPMSLSGEKNAQTLTIWATDRTEFSYEGVTQSLGQALSKLHHHFPEALKRVVQQSVPLGLDSCYSDEQRSQAIQEIEKTRQELYGVSLLHVRTRKKGLFSLLPALHCTLPYPLGTLTGAQEILKELFSRKALQNHRPESDTAVSTSP